MSFALLNALLSGLSLWRASEFTNDSRGGTNDVGMESLETRACMVRGAFSKRFVK